MVVLLGKKIRLGQKSSHFYETHAMNSIGYRLYFWMIFHMFESLLVRSLQSYYLKKNMDNFMVLMIEDKIASVVVDPIRHRY